MSAATRAIAAATMPDAGCILHATTPDLVGHARALFLEYAATLGFELGFQGFDAEPAALPGGYAVPGGTLLLAFVDDDVAGCVAMRPLADDVCEMKRLYVRAAFRGVGVGRRLATGVLEAARRAGYVKMRLDTVPAMVEAIALHGSLEFAGSQVAAATLEYRAP